VPESWQGHSLNESVHATDELARLDAVGLAAAIAAGDVSAREATEAAIARAEALEPRLNAFVVRDFERASAHATSPGPGVFSGVPTVIKDNTDVFGLPTRQGSEAIPERPAPADAPFTTQFRGTGIVVLGKSAMPEFGFNATTEWVGKPPTRNPWNTDYSTGASSGGSAALVAAGVIPIAHANDGGGSIRIPAAACGLVGLKTTRGRTVDPVESAKLPVNILTNGVVTRTVRDTATFIAAAERLRPAKGMPAVGTVEGPNDRRLRIGLVLDSITGTLTDDQTRNTVRDTALLLEKHGHEVLEIEPFVPARLADDFSHYWALLAFSIQRLGARTVAAGFDSSKTEPLTRYLASTFRKQAWKTPRAIAGLRRSTAQYAAAFDQLGVDAVLSPTVAHLTPKLGHLAPDVQFPEMYERLVAYVGFTPLHNACGTPAISVPGGLSMDGLPIGVQLSSRWGDERTLLELAYELEAARGFPSLLH
jgi:amidase